MTFGNDTFTDATSTAITAHTADDGGTWTFHPNSTSSPSAVIDTVNRLRCNRAGDNIVYHSGVPATADYDVEIDAVFLTAVGALAGVIGRVSVTVKTLYYFGYDTSQSAWRLIKNVNGTSTTLGTASQTLTASQSYHVKLEMRGSAIKGYIDGVNVISVTDSAVTAAGKAGLWLQGLLTTTTGIHIDNFTATDAPGTTLACSPTSLLTNSTGNSVTLTGGGTAWTAGTPGTPTFTLSGGTGASITAQVVASATGATITVTAGSAAGTLTITDPSTGATCGIAVVVPTTTIAVNDANLVISPGNWRQNGSTYIQSANPGAYVKFVFTGTATLDLVLDYTPLTGASISTAEYPKVVYSIDGGALTTAQPTSGTLSLATGLSTGANHTCELFIKASKQSNDRWTTPVEVLRITGFTVASGGTTITPAGSIVARRTKKALFYGDSITEGVESLGTNSGDLTSNDATVDYCVHVARALDCEYGQIGFGSQGYVRLGSGNVPKLANSYAFQSNGVARTLTGYDYIFLNHGTNDTTAKSAQMVQSDVTGFLTSLRAAIDAATVIFVVVPFSQINQSIIAAAVTAQQATDKKVYLIDLGTEYANGISTESGSPSRFSADSLHPNTNAHAALASAIAKKAQAALFPYATQASGGGTSRMGLGL